MPVSVVGVTGEQQLVKLGWVDGLVPAGSEGERASIKGHFLLRNFQLK